MFMQLFALFCISCTNMISHYRLDILYLLEFIVQSNVFGTGSNVALFFRDECSQRDLHFTFVKSIYYAKPAVCPGGI